MTALEKAEFEATLGGCFLDLVFHIYRYISIQIWSKIFLGLILKPFITSNLSTYFDSSLLIKLLRIIVEVGDGVIWLTQQKKLKISYIYVTKESSKKDCYLYLKTEISKTCFIFSQGRNSSVGLLFLPKNRNL